MCPSDTCGHFVPVAPNVRYCAKTSLICCIEAVFRYTEG